MFIDQNYAKEIGLKTQALKEPIMARNVDGTENRLGKMTQFVNLDLTINKKTTKSQLLVSCLGKQKIILGFPWLNEHNPNINWKTREFKWRIPYPGLAWLLRKHQGKPPPLLRAKMLAWMAMEPKTKIMEKQDEEERLNWTQNPTENNEILLAYTEEVQRPNEIEINAKKLWTQSSFTSNTMNKGKTSPLNNWFQKHFTTISTSLMKTKPKDSLDHACGIIRLNWKKDSNQNLSKHTI